MTSTDAPMPPGLPYIADLDDALGRAFPREWAEEWDRVGLLVGDPHRQITGILATLDPTRSAIARAAKTGANVLLTHHPAALSPPERLQPGPGPAGVIFAAVDAGVALIAEHTNLDRAPDGSAALPTKLGLRPLGGIERSPQPMTRITVYAPAEASNRIVDAMAAAGAGRIGMYERSAFTGPGMGQFTPMEGSNPYTGVAGTASSAAETRIEMLCATRLSYAVMTAAQVAHPYDEPLIVSEPVSIARGAARMGMLCEVDESSTFTELVDRVARVFGVTPRAWGNPSTRIARCVTATGSATSLIPDALSAGAEALICGEVRYHDALDAAESGLAIIEAGHDVTEWPLVELLGRVARQVPGLPADRVTIETPTAGWWTP